MHSEEVSDISDEEGPLTADFAIRTWPSFYRSPYFKLSMELVAEFNSAIQSIVDISGSDEEYKNYLVGTIQRIIANCNANNSPGFKLCLNECFDFLIRQCNEKMKPNYHHRNDFLGDISSGLARTKQKVMRDVMVYFKSAPPADASTGSLSAYSDASADASTHVPNDFPYFAPERGGKTKRKKTRKTKSTKSNSKKKLRKSRKLRK